MSKTHLVLLDMLKSSSQSIPTLGSLHHALKLMSGYLGVSLRLEALLGLLHNVEICICNDSAR